MIIEKQYHIFCCKLAPGSKDSIGDLDESWFVAYCSEGQREVERALYLGEFVGALLFELKRLNCHPEDFDSIITFKPAYKEKVWKGITEHAFEIPDEEKERFMEELKELYEETREE